MPAYFPMFVNIEGKKIVVIGGGAIARRRIYVLSDFTENLTVVAKEIREEIRALGEMKSIVFKEKGYDTSDLDGADIVLAATNDKALNEVIYRDAKANGQIVNVCSDKSLCDFYFPAVILADELVIGLTAEGLNHEKVKETSRFIRETLNGK